MLDIVLVREMTPAFILIKVVVTGGWRWVILTMTPHARSQDS
jgi:hypothetical protein